MSSPIKIYLKKFQSMNLKYYLKNTSNLLLKLFKYNLKIIFANKFIYFLLSAIAFFIFVTIITVNDADTNPTEAMVYYLLLFPGILLIFYPTVFGIQNDADAQILEILFTIPNYRYKVWLVRMVMIYILVFLIMSCLSFLCSLALVEFSVFGMVYQLMFPVFFIGSLAFMISTIIRNGFGTVVAMVIIGITLWISRNFPFLENTKWDVFLNPFSLPSGINDAVWADIVFNNRIYLSAGILLCILSGLLNLQKREKFI